MAARAHTFFGKVTEMLTLDFHNIHTYICNYAVAYAATNLLSGDSNIMIEILEIDIEMLARHTHTYTPLYLCMRITFLVVLW